MNNLSNMIKVAVVGGEGIGPEVRRSRTGFSTGSPPIAAFR